MKEEIVLEESPVGESQSNGRAECAVNLVKGQMRCMEEASDARYGKRISNGAIVMAWLSSHAAATISIYKVGEDGNTACERHKGNQSRREVAGFGGCVWYVKPKSRGNTGTAGRWGE